MGSQRTSMRRYPQNPDYWQVTSPKKYGWANCLTQSKERAREVYESRVRLAAKRRARMRRKK